MRVPVHPNDLLRNGGLKKLAKKLHKQWCSPTPITHTSALELLAQGLGYDDYQDLAACASEQNPTDTFPSQPEVKRGLLLAIKAAITPNDWYASDQAAMTRMIDSLHLRALSAFKVPSSNFQPPSHSPEPSGDSEMAALRAQMAESAQKLSSQWLSEEDIAALSKAIPAMDSLRDQALMSCMMAGLRRGECLSARPSDFSGDDERTLYVSRGVKKTRVIFPEQYWAPVRHYITIEKLAADDPILTSQNRLGMPMSSRALLKLCQTWAQVAGIEVAKISPHRIYMSVKWSIAAKAVSVSDRMASLMQTMGHLPTESLAKYYFSGPSEPGVSE